MTTRQLNIKDRTYYFYNDLINVLNFVASNLKLDKKTWKDIDIYFIGYVDKKPDWNVNSVNPLYFIINMVYGYISKKNGNKFNKVNFNSNYDKIRFLSDDSLPLGKLIYFPTLTAVNRCVFKTRWSLLSSGLFR